MPGEFAIHSFAETENTHKALDLTLQTLDRLKRDGVTAEMLESARAYVLGQYPLNFETAADWAAALGEIELYGLGPEYIDDYGTALRKVSCRTRGGSSMRRSQRSIRSPLCSLATLRRSGTR